MIRFAFACLGVALLLGALPTRGTAQAPQANPLWFQHMTYAGPIDCEGEMAFHDRFRQYMTSLHPSARRHLMSNFLIGIHPILSLVPADQLADMPCDHPPASVDFQVLPVAVRFVGPDGLERIGVDFACRDCSTAVKEPTCNAAPPATCGFTCPHPARQCARPVAPIAQMPTALTNLERLLQADAMLRRGEALSLGGRLYEALECFAEIQRLCPGTNLQARADKATQDLLVRVYGTEAEKGQVEEQAAPNDTQYADPMSVPRATPTVQAEVAQTKSTTVVYAVADLIGKGKAKGEELASLMNVVTSSVAPKTWAAAGGEGSIACYARARALIVNQTPEIHDRITDLLDALRKAKDQGEEASEKAASCPACELVGKVGCPACELMGKVASACKKCCEECEPKCCKECTRDLIPSLIVKPTAHEEKGCADFEIVLEGDAEVQEAPLPKAVAKPASSGGTHCLCLGGACAEAGLTADDLRFRWRLPVGPAVVLVQYEKRKLTVGVGIGSDPAGTSEESEHPR